MTDGVGRSPYAQAAALARRLSRENPGAAVTIEVEEPHRAGARLHYHVLLNGRRVASFPWRTQMRRSERESAAEFEAELAQASRQIERDSYYETGEAELLQVAQHAKELWSQLPLDVRNQIIANVRQLWTVRGPLFAQVTAWVASLVLSQGVPVTTAVQRAGRQFNLRPRQNPGRSVDDVRTRQYHQRQLRRGRVPGRNPQMRGRMQREQEVIPFPSGRNPSERSVPTNPWPRLLALAQRMLASAKDLAARDRVGYRRALQNAAAYVARAAESLQDRIDPSARRAQVMAELLVARHAINLAQALFADPAQARVQLDRGTQALQNARRAIGLRSV